MLRGLSHAGLGNLQSDEQLIELASRYGFQAVDIDAGGLIARHGLEQARAQLEEKGIVIGSIGLPVEWRTTEEEFRSSLKHLAPAAEAAAALGCTSCCTYVLPSTDQNAAHFMALATRRLRLCAQILGAYGIRLGLEFVGPHHLRTNWANPFIWTLAETLDWIDTIGESNVGLLFDSFHWYTNEHSIADIEALRPEQIVHVHINDAPAVPVAEVLDNGRLYPGEGVIDLAGFLAALNRIGYKGAVTQEILAAEAPQGSPEELVQRSKAGFDKVYAAAGI
ncbi:sugar phosphate isomerase/epimerase family protein [Paenibacillus radicis (ex Gao et al. 2016)]|uniref:Sugar phosphate isomerase n=1 Tax=Paenibacillus radicis (ex Gao et al. 2016) TaxID=1737354 RepID=A0A917M896_9BACL|nr:sugar phosphate isomerase/epimerase family protein [Paenibacillus radicis (ex Gao et al. 2016)]GGG85498.1 sugar phosphate isomerase [Paenibacillus radicis (ex Gao et al. 2016)]